MRVLLPLLILLSGLFVTAAGSAASEPFSKRLSIKCEALLIRTQNAFTPSMDQRLQRLLKFGTINQQTEISMTRIETAGNLIAKIIPQLEKRFEAEGLLHSTQAYPNVGIRLNREGLKTRIPFFDRIVSQDHQVFYNTYLDLNGSHLGMNPEKKFLSLSHEALYGEWNFKDLLGLVHEMIHSELEDARERNKSLLWGFSYTPDDGSYSPELDPYFSAYSKRWTAEEIFTHWTTALMAFDRICETNAAEDDPLYAYTDVAVAQVLGMMNGHQFIFDNFSERVNALPVSPRLNVRPSGLPDDLIFQKDKFRVRLFSKHRSKNEKDYPQRDDILKTHKEELRRLDLIHRSFEQMGIYPSEGGILEVYGSLHDAGGYHRTICRNRDRLWKAVDEAAGTRLSRFRHLLD